MTVRMIAGCLVALTLVMGLGGCASMGGSSGLLTSSAAALRSSP
jgi:hypothetical protein